MGSQKQEREHLPEGVPQEGPAMPWQEEGQQNMVQ